MSRIYQTGICLVALLCAGCSTWKNYAPVGTPPGSSLQHVDEQDFDLHRLEAIVFHLNGETIASIQPLDIRYGTNDASRTQLASWNLTYLNLEPVHDRLSQDNALLVIDRLKDDDGLQLNLDHLYIRIGGFDHTITIPKQQQDPAEWVWKYYSGAGKVCEGTVSFILKSDT